MTQPRGRLLTDLATGITARETYPTFQAGIKGAPAITAQYLLFSPPFSEFHRTDVAATHRVAF